MRLAENWRVWLLVPFLIFGYMETLRRATFQSFGVLQQGTAFSLLTVLVVVVALGEFYHWRGWLRRLLKFVTLSYIVGVLYYNAFSPYSELTILLGDLPTLSGSNQVHDGARFTFLLLFVFYAVLLYLITYYILERRELTELMVASALLLGVEIATSKLDISIYVILHVTFLLLLKSQIFYLYLAEQNEYPGMSPVRVYRKGWLLVVVLATFIVVSVGLALPTGKTETDLAYQPFNWIKAKVVSKFGAFSNKGPLRQRGQEVDRFYLYWGKLESFNLKGTVASSEGIVMSVKSTKPFYWRGEAADYYTGRGWKNTFDSEDYHNSSNLIPKKYGDRVPVQEVEQTFVLSPEMISEVIFTGSSPKKVEIPEKVFWSDLNDNYYSNKLDSGIVYRVVSYVPEFNTKHLQKLNIVYDSKEMKPFLQLPSKVPSRVQEKALAITKNLSNTYDKTKAIEQYLVKNYPYTLEVGPPPEGRDVVDYFLFDVKQGYCTYHSTAMVVMLRSIGIPARWVKGFTTGTYDVETDFYKVKEGDAHAWVEVYFGPYGWLPFEPTSSFRMPGIHIETAALESSSYGTEAKNAAVSVVEGKRPVLWAELPGYFNLTVILLTSLSVMLTWLNIRTSVKNSERTSIRYYYLDLMHLLEQKGLARSYNQTPNEFAAGLAQSLPEVHEEIILLTEGYLREQYGHHKIDEIEAERIREAWSKIELFIRERL